jgi:hypothetical protein
MIAPATSARTTLEKQPRHPPKYLEKPFGKSERVPNRSPECVQEGKKGNRPPLGGKNLRSRTFRPLSKQFRTDNSANFAQRSFHALR